MQHFLLNNGNHVWVQYGWFVMLRSITLLITPMVSVVLRNIVRGLYKALGADSTGMTCFEINTDSSDLSTIWPIMQTKQIQLPLFLQHSNISHETKLEVKSILQQLSCHFIEFACFWQTWFFAIYGWYVILIHARVKLSRRSIQRTILKHDPQYLNFFFYKIRWRHA